VAVFNKHNVFVFDVTQGTHNFATGALTYALTATANAPVATNSILANLTQISYTNLSTRVAGSPTTNSQTSGTYTLLLPDLVLTASGAVASFQFVDLYNDTPTSPADPLIGWYDYGSAVTLANAETFTIDYTTSTLTLA
jgi:hypothetical protein